MNRKKDSIIHASDVTEKRKSEGVKKLENKRFKENVKKRRDNMEKRKKSK